MNLLIIKSYSDNKLKSLTASHGDSEFISPSELFSMGLRGVWKYLRKNRKKVYFYIYDIKREKLLEAYKLLLLVVRAKEKKIIDSFNNNISIKWYHSLNAGVHLFFEGLYYLYLMPKVAIHIRYLNRNTPKAVTNLDKIIYLRTDFMYGIEAGGSIGHTEGVVNGFLDLKKNISVFTSKRFDGINSEISQHIIHISSFFKNFPELYNLYHTYHFYHQVKKSARKFDAIYQRYSMENFSGVLLKKKYNIPLILEYNGSEVWVASNWSKRLIFKKIAERIEMLNLRWADRIVVVSKVLKQELIKRGVSEYKIVFYPNCVDPVKFNPERYKRNDSIKKRYKIGSKLLLGFIGTFGQWHGVDILAQSIKSLTDYNHNIHFLIVGDGLLRSKVENIITDSGVGKYVTLTGRIPQNQAPQYLAACDVLLSPHVPNPDGSKFFGSPTKLFEYMAMAKGIVASDLDQIGEILEDKKTALLCRPGDVNDFVAKVSELASNEELRHALGTAARAKVLERYTWGKNIEAILSSFEKHGHE